MVTAHEYAEALMQALEHTPPNETGGVIQRFVAVVHKAGQIRLLPKISTSFERLMKEQTLAATTTVMVARKEIIETEAKHIAQAARTLAVAPETLSFAVDPTLSTGYRMRTRDKIIDASGKRALLELYQRMITA